MPRAGLSLSEKSRADRAVRPDATVLPQLVVQVYSELISIRPAFWGFPDRVGGSIQFFDEVEGSFWAALLIPRSCPLDICNRALVILNALALIHHGQEFAMQFFPSDGHSFTRFQVFDSASDFLVPSLLDRLISSSVKTVE